MKHEKVIGMFETYYSVIRKGIVCTEREDWRHRRKILSQVFNFDFIVSHIPMMATIADQVFDHFESNCKMARSEGNSEIYTVDFFEVMTKYTSSIVITGFLGMESLKDSLKGK